jgi:hypothetical protein
VNEESSFHIGSSCADSINICAKEIVVDLNGSGDFKTIQEAINSLEVSSNTPRTIGSGKGL